MRRKWTWAMILAGLAIQVPTTVQAFECRTHFAEVQVLIEEAKQAVKHMTSGQRLATLFDIREAEMILREARFHNEQLDNYRHSRAIIRANAARGYVKAALALVRGHMDE